MSFEQKQANNFSTYFALILIVVGLLNFVAFLAIGMYLGGDALNGKVENGRYYLGSHGVYTEVGYNVFIYSKVHAIIFLITHFLVFVYAGVSHLLKRKNQKSV